MKTKPDLNPGATVAIVATGWVGDTIVCSAGATSLHLEKGYSVDFYMKWPQLKGLFEFDDRFRTILYQDSFWGRFLLNLRLQKYPLVIREPSVWSYKEPKTAEIRRMAGCAIKSEYELRIPNSIGVLPAETNGIDKSRVVISRDIYKKAYGRNIDYFIEGLKKYFEIEWIGLDHEQSSKHGNQSDLLQTARAMKRAICYIGPEGGLLWLAAGIGVRTIYFTEHFHHVHPTEKDGDPWLSLGSVNMFPDGNHIAIPAFCSNEAAIEIIKNALIEEGEDKLLKA
jgi:hypothetical protein